MTVRVEIEPIDGNVVYVYQGNTVGVITTESAREFAEWVRVRGGEVIVHGNAI